LEAADPRVSAPNAAEFLRPEGALRQLAAAFEKPVRAALQSRPAADFPASDGSGEPSSQIIREKRKQACALRQKTAIDIGIETGTL
jgi:hypothetical protein